jgi:hypothetical protein
MPISPNSSDPESGNGGEAEILGRRCDFCGDVVASVRRVALDREYDRLQKAHQEQYACAPCFEKKEQDRMGMTRR